MKKDAVTQLKKKHKFGVFDVVNYTLLGLIALIILFPFYNSIIISFLSEKEFANFNGIWPKSFTLDAYKVIFSDKWVYSGYKNSIIIVVTGTLYSLFITSTCAYAFSRDHFRGRGIILKLFVFTMFCGGGMIPSYILIKNLGLMDTLLSLILPSGMAVYYMLLMRAFFLNIPRSIKEAAMIDGAGEGIILFRIVLPLSKPIIATVSLFTMVDLWNSWFSAMLYIKSADLRPLQLCLREIINNSGASTSQLLLQNVERLNTQSYTMAAVMVTMLPIMCVYPFLQKHFVKGIMIGGVKE